MRNRYICHAHVKDLSGATICVQAGTDTLLDVQDYFSTNVRVFQLTLLERHYGRTRVAAFVGQALGEVVPSAAVHGSAIWRSEGNADRKSTNARH